MRGWQFSAREPYEQETWKNAGATVRWVYDPMASGDHWLGEPLLFSLAGSEGETS